MLGIIIGVAAVIMMIAVGQGAQAQISRQITGMGANLLVVFPGAGTGAVRGAGGNVNTLTWEDGLAVAELDQVTRVAPELSTNATLSFANQTWTTQVIGTTPEMTLLKDWPPATGLFFTPDDVQTSAPVAVLGQTAADNLFPPGQDPVGAQIRINKLAFTVVGVLTPKGAALSGQDQDNIVYIPVTTAQKRLLGVKYVRLLNVQATSPESMAFVQTSIENLLHERHRLGAQAANDFTVRNMTSLLEMAESTTAIMTLLLASVAAVSLLVGGIGIMNIMLVSVTERTKEIGLRMAVGATERHIRNQFLTEALVLCLTGGILGIGLGYGGAKIISALAGWPTAVSLGSVLLATGFSAGIGIFFGYYPAKKAAALDPITALRFEN
ncbi:MAG: ABC transporter permease [Heliobacteriaceae bacterium]|nr:ABC transporter permease [Heliobacteriaceae bacterium]